MTAAKFAKDMNIETSLVVAILKSRGDVIKGSNTITDEQMDFVKTNLNKQEEKERRNYCKRRKCPEEQNPGCKT